MRAEHYETITDLVHARVVQGNEDALASPDRAVTVRLYPHEVDELDMLAKWLNYSRQQLLAQIIATGLNDGLNALGDALGSDEHLFGEFQEERMQIARDHQI